MVRREGRNGAAVGNPSSDDLLRGIECLPTIS
jgi:hypothetical protein